MLFEPRSSTHLKTNFDLERQVSKPSRRMFGACFVDKPVANPQNFENLSAHLADARNTLGLEQRPLFRIICGRPLASTPLEKAAEGSA